MAQLKISFLQSQTLWEQMRYLERKGTMHLVRDYNLIFHGCVPVDEVGAVPAHARGRRGVSRPGAVRRARRGGAPGLPRQGGSPTSTCCGICGAARCRRCSARTRSPRSRVISSPTRRRTRRRRTRTSSSSTRSRFAGASCADFGVDEAPRPDRQRPRPGEDRAGRIAHQGERAGDHHRRRVFRGVRRQRVTRSCLTPDRTYLARHHHFESYRRGDHAVARTSSRRSRT